MRIRWFKLGRLRNGWMLLPARTTKMKHDVKTTLAALAVFATALAPTMADAYIGPGAGITALGSLFALIGAVLMAIVGFVWFPIKRMLKGRRKPAAAETPASGTEQA